MTCPPKAHSRYLRQQMLHLLNRKPETSRPFDKTQGMHILQSVGAVITFGARRLANLRDPDDPVTKIITTERVAVLKDEYGTKPHVFYLGLDNNVR